MLYNMSYPSVPAGGLAPPPAKHWGHKPNTLSTSFPIPSGPSIAPPRPTHLPPGMPFDPAELSRRLAIVERKQLAKERARAAQAALGSRLAPRSVEASPNINAVNGSTAPINKPSEPQRSPPYRHIPSNTATQFALTATNDSIRGAEFSHQRLNGGVKSLAIDEKINTIEKRPQVHPSRIPEDMMPSIAVLDNRAKPRTRPHTVEGNALVNGAAARSLSGGHARHQSASAAMAYGGAVGSKRVSKASFEADGKTRHSWMLLSPPPPESETPGEQRRCEGNGTEGHLDDIDQTASRNGHGVDWTQRDEEGVKGSDAMKRSPKMKKPDSIWTLKGRLSSLGRHHDKEKESSGGSSKEGGTVVSSPKKAKSSMDLSGASPLKSPMGGFFARFKRQ